MGYMYNTCTIQFENVRLADVMFRTRTLAVVEFVNVAYTVVTLGVPLSVQPTMPIGVPIVVLSVMSISLISLASTVIVSIIYCLTNNPRRIVPLAIHIFGVGVAIVLYLHPRY